MKKSELRQLVKEELNSLKTKKQINEGFITDFITSMAMLVLSGKSKQIDNMIDPIGRRDVIKASNDFKKSVENLRNLLNSPSVKQSLKDSGMKPEDFGFYNTKFD